MPKLIYSYLASLDGYITDDVGKFDWAEPDEEVLEFINETERSVGTYLYGRKIYQMMIGWETDPSVAAQSPKSAEFARIWQRADKVVFSSTLQEVSTERTRIERSFDSRRSERSRRASIMTWLSPVPAWHPPRGGWT